MPKEPTNYRVTINSNFILTQTYLKEKLGLGFTISKIEVDRDRSNHITDVDSAVQAIIATGYKALARAHHPDFGGDTEKFVILNRARQELKELLNEVGLNIKEQEIK